MGADPLFRREESVIDKAEAALQAGYAPHDEAGAAVKALLAAYKKLVKTSRRLMRHSDRNERELAAMVQRERAALKALEQKKSELETLSGKLAKYLSPQVYDSIFSGRQEVKLASQRKKLTVFFSDIANFTETTDKMESEDLTELINHYLTEMSQVALQYGATIDKYIGDAIMIFFGDPETKGVRQDALACVKMALAMQERMRALSRIWRARGVAEPLTCRIGIHTGYCTVGNFGSADRMDYTIIGGAVNLAARLEKLARPGGVLVSYETYAHIRDEARCEEAETLAVRGLAYPVATYNVLDLWENAPRADDGHIRFESPHMAMRANIAAMTAQERSEALREMEAAMRRLRALE